MRSGPSSMNSAWGPRVRDDQGHGFPVEGVSRPFCSGSVVEIAEIAGQSRLLEVSCKDENSDPGESLKRRSSVKIAFTDDWN